MVPDPNETEISDTNSDQTAVAQSEPTNADVNETDAASAAETEEDGGTVVERFGLKTAPGWQALSSRSPEQPQPLTSNGGGWGVRNTLEGQS